MGKSMQVKNIRIFLQVNNMRTFMQIKILEY